jgi:hypothetical protein
MNNSITDSATLALLGAAGKYGSDLLADTVPDDADGTLRTARNLLARVRIVPDHGAAIAAAVGDIVENGEDPGRTAGLHAALDAAVGGDSYLASDLTVFLSESAG